MTSKISFHPLYFTCITWVGCLHFRGCFQNYYEKPSDLSHLIWCECIKNRISRGQARIKVLLWCCSSVSHWSRWFSGAHLSVAQMIFMGCVGGCIHVFVCMRDGAFRECLTFSQWAGFTQRRCHTSPIQLIAGQRGFCQTDRCSSLTFVLFNICSQKISQASLSATDSQPPPLRLDMLKNLPFPYVFIKEQ